MGIKSGIAGIGLIGVIIVGIYLFRNQIAGAIAGGIGGIAGAVSGAFSSIKLPSFSFGMAESEMQKMQRVAAEMDFAKDVEKQKMYEMINPNLLVDPNAVITTTVAGAPVINYAGLFKFNPPNTVFYGFKSINMGRGISYVEAFKQGLIPKEGFLSQGIDIDKLLMMNLAMDMPAKMRNAPVISPLKTMLSGFMQTIQGQGAGGFTVTERNPLSRLINQYGLTASQAADLRARQTMDTQYRNFNFGTNTGSGRSVMMGTSPVSLAFEQSRAKQIFDASKIYNF